MLENISVRRVVVVAVGDVTTGAFSTFLISFGVLQWLQNWVSRRHTFSCVICRARRFLSSRGDWRGGVHSVVAIYVSTFTCCTIFLLSTLYEKCLFKRCLQNDTSMRARVKCMSPIMRLFVFGIIMFLMVWFRSLKMLSNINKTANSAHEKFSENHKCQRWMLAGVAVRRGFIEL